MAEFTKQHADRLLTLAWFLKTQVKPSEFDMGSWVKGDSKNLFREHTCGTTACAVGYCPVVFPRQWKYDGAYKPMVIRQDPYFESGYEESEFFGVNGPEWIHLFGCYRKRTPKQEALVIERFVKKKGYVYA